MRLKVHNLTLKLDTYNDKTCWTVICAQKCDLGLSRHQPTLTKSLDRIRLHENATLTIGEWVSVDKAKALG